MSIRDEVKLSANLGSLFQHVIKTRNADIVRRIEDEYRDHPVAKSTQTFCVSNKIYWESRKKPAAPSQPYLRLSGIMELRRCCIGIVAESYLRAIHHYVNDEIPTLLGSISLLFVAGSGDTSDERQQEILNSVIAIQEKVYESNILGDGASMLGEQLRNGEG
ncbi:hypothetical protein N0V90_001752 [Kalmusia sp. IMI 367209]|nr:hypothetical protein N0V90_001752 [Kalmusia sp. IMI 367209]